VPCRPSGDPGVIGPLAAVATAALAAAASAVSGVGAPPAGSHRHDSPAHRPPPVAVRVASTQYGHALVDRRGFALYQFTRDGGPRSTCSGACAAAWPPYIVARGRVGAADGARQRLIGTTRRADGRLQVTYRSHPLYYYVGDRRPHQVLCQAVREFGGDWYVVAPDGRAITQ
jgi:predicted lipoprotein with Yx(FWY)xxD motif